MGIEGSRHGLLLGMPSRVYCVAPALGRVVRPAGLSVAIAILDHTLLDFCWGATPPRSRASGLKKGGMRGL